MDQAWLAAHITTEEILISLVGAVLLILVPVLIVQWKAAWFIYSCLNKAVNQLKEIGNVLGRRQYNELDEGFKANGLLANPWREFRETLVIDEADDQISILNTQQAEMFFSFERLAGPRLSLSFLDAVPGMLTGLGLLGTFVALYLGLEALHVKQDMEVTGIGSLINNLSVKFISSIIGVGLAVVFMLQEKVCVYFLEKKTHQFNDLIDELFPRVVAERLLSEMLKSAKEQASLLAHFDSDLSNRLKSSLEQSMQPTMERMIDAVNGLAEMTRGFHNQSQPTSEKIVSSIDRLVEVTKEVQNQKGEESTQALEDMVGKFSERLSSGANAEIANLASVLSKTGEALSNMTERMETSMSVMDGRIQAQQNDSEAQRDALSKSISEIISKFESHSIDHLQEIQNSTAGVSERLEQHMTTSLAAYQRQQEENANLAKAQQHEIQETVDSLMKKISEMTSGQSGQLEALMESVVSKLNHSANSLAEQMTQTADQSGAQSKYMASANQALQATILSVRELLASNETVLGHWKGVSSDLSQMTGSLKQSSGQMREVQELATVAVHELSKQMKQYEDSMANMQNVWAQQRELHQWLDSNFSNVLKELNDAMIKFKEHTHQALGNSLTDFDKSLANAVGKLAVTVQDLDGKLDELTDTMERTLSKAKG